MAKHTTNAESSPPLTRQHQIVCSRDGWTTPQAIDSPQRQLATACRPVNVVEDDGLLEIVCIAFNDNKYDLTSRATVTSKINNFYEEKKAKVVEVLRQINTVELTGDYSTSLSNHSYLGVIGHYFDIHWKVMKTGERHYADVCTEHFLQVAKQRNIELKLAH